MINYLIKKFPLVRSWIDATIESHAEKSLSIKTLILTQKLKRLPQYFTDNSLYHTRVVIVDKVPVPPLSSLGVPVFGDFEKGDYGGITYKNTYFIKRQCLSDESLHFHELIHIIQWAYLGVDKFLLAYALGLIENGYKESPLEKMAYNHQQLFESNSNPYSVEDAIKLELDILLQNIGYLI